MSSRNQRFLDLRVGKIPEMRKEPKSAAEEKAEVDVKKDKPIYYTYMLDEASSTMTASENVNEPLVYNES